jgi:hypothetical protein
VEVGIDDLALLVHRPVGRQAGGLRQADGVREQDVMEDVAPVAIETALACAAGAVIGGRRLARIGAVRIHRGGEC